MADTLQLPVDLETASAMLNDPAEVNKWFMAGKFSDLQKRFNELERPPLGEQVADILAAREAQNGTVANATKAAMDEWMRDHGMAGTVARPDVNTNRASVPVRNAYAKQIEDIGFTNIGDFARATWHRNSSDDRRAEVVKIMNAYSSTEPSAGGFLIPETLDGEIRALVLEQSMIRSRATVIQMTAPTMLFPFVDVTTNVGSTFGGWTVTRVEEGGTITPSQAKFGRVKLSVSKQVAGAEVPNEMFVDVSALDGFIRSTLPQSMAFSEDYDFLLGNGANGPLGILNAANTALITVAKETNQTASTIVLDNILKIYARMLPSSKGRAVWLVSQSCFPQLMQLSIAVGTGGAPVMLVDASGPGPKTMLGLPIIETEKVPALGSAGQLGLYDLSYYLIGDRPGSGLESSPHAQFMNDITEMKLTARNDGRPWIQSAITPANGGDTLSPFVTLGAVA
jgi:HK97 family phage major capsid protein